MVEFLTLFLGLVSGSHEVAVSVAEPVARVELRLDGEHVGWVEAPSWRGTVDLGPELLPHVLEAVAYDTSRRELGRSVQRVNLPRPAVEASLVLERGPDAGAAATLIWESARGESPSSVVATLDGEPVPIDPTGRIALPELDSGDTHLLQAELHFPSGNSASAHLAFGGALIETAESELTAIPLQWRGGGRAKSGTLKRWLSEPASKKVVAFEQGGALLLVVKGPGLGRALSTLETPFDRGSYDGGLTSSIGTLGPAGLDSPAVAPQAVATPEERRLRAMAFEDAQRVRMVLPQARQGKGREIALELFAVSPEVDGEGRGLLWLLGADVEVPDLEPDPRLGDAVALAGLLAAQADRRRAVLVVLDGTQGPTEDDSLYRLEVARRYLEALGVPLFVWRLGASSDDGPVEGLADYRALEKAYQRLQRSLEQQWIMWLEGSWLPTEVAVRDGAPFALLAH